MSGLGGLNKTPDGVVIGLVQLQLPTIATKADLAAQTKKICAMVQKARKACRRWISWSFPNIRCMACRWIPTPS